MSRGAESEATTVPPALILAAGSRSRHAVALANGTAAFTWPFEPPASVLATR